MLALLAGGAVVALTVLSRAEVGPVPLATANLQIADPGDVRQYDSFFFVQQPGVPYPYNPLLESNLPTYFLWQIDPGSKVWLVDDSSVDRAALEEQWAMERALRRLERQYGLASPMSLFELDDEGQFSGSQQTSYAPGDLYLTISGVTSNANLVLNGSQSGAAYWLLSHTNPAAAATPWGRERLVFGAAGQDFTPISVPVLTRTNSLFFRGLVSTTNDATWTGLSVAITNPPDGTYLDTWPTNVPIAVSATSTNGDLLGVASTSWAGLPTRPTA